MKAPLFIRPLSQDEHWQIQAGLRSSDAFVLRRCQILLASAPGERAPAIAKHLGCDDQTVRNAIKGFNTVGLAVLKAESSRPHRLRTTFTPEAARQLKALLHRSPRDFGLDRGLWTSVMWSNAMGCSPPSNWLSGFVTTLGVLMNRIFLFPKRFRNYALDLGRKVPHSPW